MADQRHLLWASNNRTINAVRDSTPSFLWMSFSCVWTVEMDILSSVAVPRSPRSETRHWLTWHWRFARLSSDASPATVAFSSSPWTFSASRLFLSQNGAECSYTWHCIFAATKNQTGMSRNRFLGVLRAMRRLGNYVKNQYRVPRFLAQISRISRNSVASLNGSTTV